MVLLVLESDSMNFNINHALKISKIHRAKQLWDSIKYLIGKLKKLKRGRKLHPSISTHNLLYFIISNLNVFFFLIFTLKDNVFYVAENHFTLKETEPKVYVKWKDLESHQWKRLVILLIFIHDCAWVSSEWTKSQMTPTLMHPTRTAFQKTPDKWNVWR